MLYELRTYTVRAGTAPDVAKTSATLGQDIRGDKFGKLEGYWITEIGPLNQVMHLWSYADYDDRARLRGELSKNKRWVDEYLPTIRERLVRQEVRLLNAVIAPVKPAQAGNVYEFRHYRLRAGGAGPWLQHFTGALKAREKYSKIVALFTTEAPQPNEVCHIWAYPDLNARAAARGAAMQDPDWKAFLAKSSELRLPEEMSTTIMLPAQHSPLR